MGQLLSMNLTASFLILVILLLRHFCGRILSRRCFVWLSMIGEYEKISVNKILL